MGCQMDTIGKQTQLMSWKRDNFQILTLKKCFKTFSSYILYVILLWFPDHIKAVWSEKKENKV